MADEHITTITPAGNVDAGLQSAMDAEAFKDDGDWKAPPFNGAGRYRFCPVRWLAYLERFEVVGRPPELPSYGKQIPFKEFERLRKLGFPEYTYFAQGTWSGRIKIGMSKDPWRRIGELYHSSNGEPATELLVLRGDHMETVYQRAFRKWLDGNEWFAPHPDIHAEIKRIKSAGEFALHPRDPNHPARLSPITRKGIDNDG